MPRLYKRGRYYYADLFVEGRHIRRSLGLTNKAAAEYRFAKIQYELAQGKDPWAGRDFAEVKAEHLEYCATRNRPGTVKMKALYLARLKSLPGRAEIEAAAAAIAAESGNPSANRALTTYNAFFNWACAREIYAKNPAKGIPRLHEARRPIHVLTTSEREKYFAWCAVNDPLLFDLSIVALNTGLRRGDLLKIHADDVDTERRILTVRVNKRSGALVQYIPLNAAALEVLARRGPGFIFPGRGVDHAVEIQKRFKRALKATRLKFRFMEFRHNFATDLLRGGVADVLVVKDLLGHTKVETTMRYLSVDNERSRSAVDNLCALSVRGSGVKGKAGRKNGKNRNGVYQALTK